MIRLSLACNNPDNGLYIGTFCGAELETGDGYQISLYASELEDFEMFRSGTVLVVGFRQFETSDWKYGYGNWCWDACWIELETGRELIRLLLELGFRVEEATCDGPFADLAEQAFTEQAR